MTKNYRLSTKGVSLLVIVGPTASGKSDLAMRVARKYGGEIICADSRTIYIGMDIGTAKPSLKDRKSVPHWGLDILNPGQKYSAAKFKVYANNAIEDIQKRGKLPILVGGTGLYVDAVVFDYSFVGGKSQRLYSIMPNPALRIMIRNKGWKMPENYKNRRHLLATVRRKGKSGKRNKAPRSGTVMIGISPNDEVLRKRISKRAEAMFDMGIINETRESIQHYGEKILLGNAGIEYGIVARQLKGEITQEQAEELFVKSDWQYARRQKTWFRRNPYIHWFGSANTALKYVNSLLK